MISKYEEQYIEALHNIYAKGFEDGTNERTGMTTKRLPGIVIRVDVEEEFPILKSKFVAGKTAQREIEWIWKQQSNNIKDLKAKIWDEWALPDGSIGKAYGYQIGKPIEIYLDTVNKTPESFRSYPSQAHFVIGYLKEVPNGRQCVTTIWNPTELKDMQLVPCCHTATWNLDGGRLNCVLDQRSGDMPYGVPFNTTQYAILMHMFAKELGVKPGILTHVIADAHIYANQMEGVKLQLAYYELLLTLDHKSYGLAEFYADKVSKLLDYEQSMFELINKASEALACNPKFAINTDKDFFDYTADDCVIEDYKNMGKIDFGEVAV